MTTLPVPMVSQLSNLTQDHLPSENQQMDCVPACLCAGIMCLLGITSVSTDWNPDRILNMAYPEGYKGATSAANFVQPLATLGIHLFPVQGNNAYLVQQAHSYVDSSSPVIITIPDPYVDLNLPQFNGWTHVNCLYETGSGFLVGMDPYPAGHPVSKSDATWASLFQFGEIWVLQKAQQPEMNMIIDLTTPGVSDWFASVPGNANQWQCKSTGRVIQYGILDAYKRYCNSDLCGVTWLGLPMSNEITLDGPIVKQYFERGVLVYDPSYKRDKPPGITGSVYPAYLYDNRDGQDPLVGQLQTALTQADAQLTSLPQLQSQLAQDAAQIMALQQQMSQQGQPDPLIAEVKTDLTALLGKLG